jgi:hypothetical protein
MKNIFFKDGGRSRKQGIEWHLLFTFILSVTGTFIVFALIYMGEAYHKIAHKKLKVV